MITPHTKPGTKVVCVNADGLSLTDGFTPCPLVFNQIYTVVEIEDFNGAYYAELLEVGSNAAFGLRRFRYLELPKSISDCLTEQPLLVDELSRALTGDKSRPALSPAGVSGGS